MALTTPTTEYAEPTSTVAPVRARWLGVVDHAECWDLQSALFTGTADHLLLCEHPPVYTLGVRADPENVLVDPATLGADLVRVDRGGDVTFHGPGQLVGYPVMTVPGKRGGGMADTVAYVAAIEQAVIDAVAELGLVTGRLSGYPGVWVDPDGRVPRKLAAVGVRLSRGRSMHGFALNVDVDLASFDAIVPCGITDKAVTSLAAEGIDTTMGEVVDLAVDHLAAQLAPGRAVERQDVAWRVHVADLAAFTRGAGAVAPDDHDMAEGPPRSESVGERGGGAPGPVPVTIGRRVERRLTEVGVDAAGVAIDERKPPWLRVKVRTDPAYLRMKRLTSDLRLTTVCEEAGCPNIFDCWSEGTATFMLLGERCTRACGFCLVDTRRPGRVDADEPRRVAEAVASLDLDYAVLTMVARDDLDDGGAGAVAATIHAIRAAAPEAGIEVLVSDLGGSPSALATVCDAEPDVLAHNVETVARLQRAVRPSAGYARSLAVLARAASLGMTTKSGLMVGLGERDEEVVGTLADLRSVGVQIVTIGQYLRPTAAHLPVQRWWTPDELAELRRHGEGVLGIPRVEASPLTRSSHHAGSIARSLDAAGDPAGVVAVDAVDRDR